MSTAPSRFYVTFQNSALNFRVQSHNTDPKLLVVKSKHPEALDSFIMATGTDIGVQKSIKGNSNNIAFVDKDKFSAAMVKFCTSIVHVPGGEKQGGDTSDLDPSYED